MANVLFSHGNLTTLVCLSVSQSCSELTRNKVYTDGQKKVKGHNVATLMTSGWCLLTWRCFGQARPLEFGGFWRGYSAI